MKIHCTSSIYGFQQNEDLKEKQKFIMECSRELGFYEAGIFIYPVDTDQDEELSSRLDGIIAAIEPEDLVLLQLPTGNGIKFESQLISKVKKKPHVKLILLFHELDGYESLAGFELADKMIVANNIDLQEARRKGLRIQAKVGIPNRFFGKMYMQRFLLELVTDYTLAEVENDNKADIHIGFGLHDKTGNYSVFVGIVILSVLQHTNHRICFHVFHDDTLTDENIEKLSENPKKYGSTIIFHRINADMFQSDNAGVNKYSIGCMFRLIMPRVLHNVHKLIYMDADLMVLRDIAELWETDMSDYALAGVHDIGFEHGIRLPDIVESGDVQMKKYINSGLLLMNLDRIRMHGDLLELSLKYLTDHPNSSLPDQDALNYLFKDEILLLDRDWNRQTRYERQSENKLREKVVYHFMGERFISYDRPTEYDKYYLRLKGQTPWGYEAIEQDIFRGYFSLTDKIEMLQKLILQLGDPNKKRIFFGKNTQAMNSVRRFLLSHQGDYCVEEDMIDSNGKRYGLEVKTFEDIRNEENGTFIVLVLPEAADGKALEMLESLGLKTGEDYFVIPRILLGSQGGYWA